MIKKIKPDINNSSLVKKISVFDETGNASETFAIEEKPISIYLNDTHIVTAMTIGDYPEYLAIGFLANQNILNINSDDIPIVEYYNDIETVVVRTKTKTNFEVQEKNKIKTSGCANGTIFGNLLENFEKYKILNSSVITAKQIFNLYKKINLLPSLYLKSGAIHGCLLCTIEEPLAFFEDVGRHNAIDKLAGFMIKEKVLPHDKILYTTGRLTSEMVIKAVMMKLPIIASRSGFTAWGVDLARKSNITMIGRLRGRTFTVLSGNERVRK
ncbi:MAG: sulfurtransferase FdhD [Pelagibacterales bacterium]|nr:sulfurtransferase FdhD [Pelagibacterales bacterium]